MKKEKNIQEIIKKYIDGEISKEDLQNAIPYFKNTGCKQPIKNLLKEYWIEDIYKVPPKYQKKNFSHILENIHQIIEPELKYISKKETRKLFINISRIAAALIIGIFIGILSNTLEEKKPVYYTSITPKGSISQMVLPDSTIVYLNSDTELKYTYNNSRKKREVFLNGEAWFQVNENKKKPFVVNTAFYKVIVTGTEFNIKAYEEENEIVTTLESGAIVIPSTGKFRMRNFSK